jgi:hypothetical protein
MHPKKYFLFHLNLVFSSVDKGSWITIVDRYYWLLLDIISDLKVSMVNHHTPVALDELMIKSNYVLTVFGVGFLNYFTIAFRRLCFHLIAIKMITN